MKIGLDIQFTDNIENKLIDTLAPSFQEAIDIKLGVAFAKYSGFHLIEEYIKKCLKNGGKAEFLFGLDFRTTEPNVLRILREMENGGLNTKLYCFSDPLTDDAPVYHPKIYILRSEKKVVISVGSSNLTAGGLKNNIEVNTIFKADIKDELVSDMYGIFNKLKFQKDRFEPDLEYIENYEQVYDIFRKRNIQALTEKRIRNKIEDLKQREKILPRPKLAINELFGWQKLVYERLPEEIFQTNGMYIYEKEFQKFYPENKHIKDKIRQILQQLRDLGLLKYVTTNKWSKI